MTREWLFPLEENKFIPARAELNRILDTYYTVTDPDTGKRIRRTFISSSGIIWYIHQNPEQYPTLNSAKSDRNLKQALFYLIPRIDNPRYSLYTGTGTGGRRICSWRQVE